MFVISVRNEVQLLFTNSSPGLNHICVMLGPAPPTPHALAGLPGRTFVGTLPRWEPM